jgi:amino acid adenylation domain-containing protein
VTRLLHHPIADQAQLRPDATALVLGDERVSYGELDERSNRLANLLRAHGADRGDRIGILMPKRPDALVCIVAALKADCVYVPYDPDSPAPRLAKILEASRPRWVLTVPESATLLDESLALIPEGSGPLVMSLTPEAVGGTRFESSLTRADWDAADTRQPSTANVPDDPAYVLFTSGSTGTPKGVVITHRNVLAYSDWFIEHCGVVPGDRHSLHPPLHFDLSTGDIYGTICAGAELHFVPPAANLLPQKLAQLIRSSRLNQWISVPSIMNYMAKFDVIEHGDFPELKRVLWCGEVLPTKTLMHWMERLPHARFTNMYGPTEATCASTYFDILERPDDPTTPIPIGTPCTGEDVLVLDDEMTPVPDNEIGELYIAGVGVSPGYWEDPEKTAAAFVPSPFASGENPETIYKTGDLGLRDGDGILHYVGRADTQIKSRGYRVELGEIEAALSSLEGLRESAVVAVPTDGFEGHAICCAYAVPPESDLVPAELRSRLGALIPKYMLPSHWHVMEALPKNANGKVDRPWLKEHFTEVIEAQ